ATYGHTYLLSFPTRRSSDLTITNCIFELATNADIQERLCAEFTKAVAGVDVESEEYYDTVLHKMPYLDAVIKETLRKYPPVFRRSEEHTSELQSRFDLVCRL